MSPIYLLRVAPLACISLLAVTSSVACNSSSPNDGGSPPPRPTGDVGAPSASCGSVRLTSYQPFDRGWCEYDTRYSFLPTFVREGLTAAIAEPWNGSSYGGAPGEACGECWEIDTVTATEVVMITDLCPNQGNSLCQGSHFHIDLTEDAARMVGGGALDEGQARRVPCPVSGDIHLLVNDHEFAYLRVALMNHRVPLRGVEMRATGAGVTGDNPWTALTRSGGAWEAHGSMPHDRGGDGVQFRLTSAQGQVVESSVVVPTRPERGSTFDLGVQVDDSMPPEGAACVFETPGDVFVDEFGGIDQVRWQLDPWGPAEGAFFGADDQGCDAGSAGCIRVERFHSGSGMHIYYRQRFPTYTFSSVSLRVRTDGPTSRVQVGPSYEGTRCELSFFDIGPEWSTITLDVTERCGALEWLNSLSVDLAGADITLFLDNVRFE